MKVLRKADTEWKPFELSTVERKAVHKWLSKQAKGEIPEPLHNLTLNRYFEIVREAMLALCDDDGNYRGMTFGSISKNYKKMTPKEAAEACMDGRSLFHSDYGDAYGILGDIDPDDPVKFKWWVTNANYGGHPWEVSFGNLIPYPIWKIGYNSQELRNHTRNLLKETSMGRSQYYSDDWFLYFSDFHRCSPYALRCFIRLRELGFPVIWRHKDDARYLTKRYAVDSSHEPEWFQLDESFFQKGNHK